MAKLGIREQKLHATATQRDVAFFRERARERQANLEKTNSLRALRLAKEATERVAAELAAAEKASKPKRVRRRAGAPAAIKTVEHATAE